MAEENKQNKVTPDMTEASAGDTPEEIKAEEEAKETSAEETKPEDGEAKEAEKPETEESEAKAQEEKEAEDTEKYMRLLAEFQNFKKRAAKEKTDIHAYANEKLMSELLPVLDNFERALETKTDEVQAYAKGMELIFEQMKTALENHGLKKIEALGEDFDPAKHNAVMMEEPGELESGKVSKELQKGYELNGKVIRPTMVAVVK